MSKYGDLIKQARNPENQITRKSENQIDVPNGTKNTPEPEMEVNLCIKV